MSTPHVIEAEVVDERGGAVVPFVARPEMTPAEVRATVEWQAELLRAVLEEGVDFGLIPRTPKPCLWKPGAEKLLKAHGFGHHMEPVGGIVERDEQGRRRGVTYRCVVTKPVGDRDMVVSTCEGYCGYDDKSRRREDPWNTILKMAQKRALVGATLTATGTSGLLTQDLEDYHDDDQDDDAPARPPRPATTAGGVPVCSNCGGSLAGSGPVKTDAGHRFHVTCPTSEKGGTEPTSTDHAGAGRASEADGGHAPPEAVPDEPLMTGPQRGKLFALLGERGITGDLERQAWAARELGQTGAVSFTTLTKAQAKVLIDKLEAKE